MLFRGAFRAYFGRGGSSRTIPSLVIPICTRMRLLAAAEILSQGGGQPFFPVSGFACHAPFPCRKAWVIASAPKIAPQQFCVRMPE